jgi:hypothetical protein
MSVPALPESDLALIIRTDYSDDEAWNAIRAVIATPVDGFEAYVAYAEHPGYAGLTSAQVVGLFSEAERSYAMVVDSRTISDPEHPLLIIDIFDVAHPEFRAIPMAIQSIENNLSIANMDFEEFASAADEDGVFRNFRVG